MKIFNLKTLSTGLVIATGAVLYSCEDSNPLPNRDYELEWADEFNGTEGSLPDPSVWIFETGTGPNNDGWGNQELQYYTDRAENAHLDGNGNLVITAIEESFEGSSYTSARLITKGTQEFQYGRIEARIKTPFGQGLWPAFWMLGSDIDTNEWPEAGEIDIMELRGQEPRIIAGSIHGPGYSGGDAVTEDFELLDGRFDTEFHVFAVEWGPNFIDYFVDDRLYQRLSRADVPEAVEEEDDSFCVPQGSDCIEISGEDSWVFDKPFYLLLNVAVGGSYVGSPNDNSRFPQTMVVDYVRVYQ